jgi:hypothetical protein
MLKYSSARKRSCTPRPERAGLRVFGALLSSATSPEPCDASEILNATPHLPLLLSLTSIISLNSFVRLSPVTICS